MKSIPKNVLKLGLAVVALAMVETTQADFIYRNDLNDLTARFTPTAEVGNQVIFADNGARTLTNFTFEYFITNLNNSIVGRVRFYANDGPLESGVASPGTVLYDSGAFTFDAGFPTTERSTLVFDDFVTDATVPLTGDLPDEITWTVEFGNVGTGEAVGVDLYAPANLGQNYLDYWERVVGDWTLQENADPNFPITFAATFEAVPEPGTMALLGVGGVAGLLFLRRRNSRK